ncbi:hypothetical protein [Paenibacillus woosongensis]|uniref:hypothetical protein n=1 Tax=Paenibacillus woosongensis TaxID=307580 RepID=UPI0039B6EEA9
MDTADEGEVLVDGKDIAKFSSKGLTGDGRHDVELCTNSISRCRWPESRRTLRCIMFT